MIFYDITDLINHARQTHKVSGIQRVVLEGLKGSLENVKPFFISPMSGNIYLCENISLEQLQDLKIFENMWIETDLLENNCIDIAKVYLDYYIKKSSKNTLLKKIFFTSLSIPIMKNISFFVFDYAVKRKFERIKSKIKYSHITYFPEHSTLEIFGGVWNFQSQYEKIFNELHKSIKKNFLVYDMIPVYSNYVPEELRKMFLKYIPFVLKNANTIVVNAESTKKDIERFVAENNYSCPNTKVIHLAHKLSEISISSDYIPPLRAKKLAVEKYILCVGSIESRKNHINLLLMWKKFINSEFYANEKLVIAGRWLWDTEIIQQLLTYTGHLYGSVIVIDNPDDEELIYLYKNCRFTVYPSHYEGWGLPLGESLAYGKPCIHFDNSSLKEAGYGLTEVIEYPNYNSFYLKMVDLLKDDQTYENVLKKIQQNNHLLREWNHFAQDIHSLIVSEK